MSFANSEDHLQELFVVEGTPTEIMSDNGPPSSGFIERQIHMVQRLTEKAITWQRGSLGEAFLDTPHEGRME